MNKVIYFTNAVDQKYFKEDYLRFWIVSPNLSNQNFHNKLIKALSVNFKVDIVSVRPINANYKDKMLFAEIHNIGNACWRYPKVTKNKLSKLLLLNHRIKNVFEVEEKESVIFVDALNLSLLKAAKRFAKKYHNRIIGICTDNPLNISFTNAYYNKQLIKLGQSLDGYVVLTDAINKFYNVHNKPFIKIDGVSEEFSTEKKPLVTGKYIYFGGSLMHEYGVYNLIEAYKELNLKDIQLVLCGHHPVNDLFDAIKDNMNIKYLGPVSYEDNLVLEKNSVLSVNPRPINPKIDDYSIPSKTLECLAVGALNITVKNKLLEEHYRDCIIWADSSKVEDLKAAIKKALALSDKERNVLIELGKQKVMERTSIEHVAQLLHDLII